MEDDRSLFFIFFFLLICYLLLYLYFKKWTGCPGPFLLMFHLKREKIGRIMFLSFFLFRRYKVVFGIWTFPTEKMLLRRSERKPYRTLISFFFSFLPFLYRGSVCLTVWKKRRILARVVGLTWTSENPKSDGISRPCTDFFDWQENSTPPSGSISGTDDTSHKKKIKSRNPTEVDT